MALQDQICSSLHKGFPYKTFMAWDTDKSGKITPDEARQLGLL